VSGKVLVTGGAGYVGSHACKALAKAGFEPVSYDNLSRGHEWAVRWGPLERGEVLDASRLQEAFAKHRPVAVMHFAALAYVGESVQKPDEYYTNNVGGSLSLLKVMRAHGVDRIVFSSTCSTYGLPQRMPIAEDHRQEPVNPYGASKLMVERMLADYDSAYGLRYAALRYFNAAGADPEGEIGEVHHPETHLIPLALMAAAGLRQLTVHGADYPTPDGTCVRDYVHVSDLADAHVAALRHLLSDGASCAVNLGTERGASVREVIAAAARATGNDLLPQIGQRRPGDPPELVASCQRARAILGWSPRYPDLEGQVRHAWAWFRTARSRGYISPDMSRIS
jgi:UDP-arabinose 4-epimerase